eukprot:1026011-Amorphochlora_amoeboformis.AAC.1
MWRVTGDYRIIPGEHSLFFLGEHTKSLQCHGEFIGDYDLLRHRPLAKATLITPPTCNLIHAQRPDVECTEIMHTIEYTASCIVIALNVHGLYA